MRTEVTMRSAQQPYDRQTGVVVLGRVAGRTAAEQPAITSDLEEISAGSVG